MRKLLRANFARLARSKAFWFSMLAMVAFGFFAIGQRLYNAAEYGLVVSVDDVFFASYPALVFLLAIFASLFIGTEYSDGTMRNKLITGSSRATVYLSLLITCAAAGFLMTLAYMAICLVGSIWLGWFVAPLSTVFLLMAAGVLLIIALSALYTLAAMLIPNKTFVVILVLVSSIVLFLQVVYMYSELQEPATYEYITMNEGGEIITESGANPGYMTEAERARTLFILDVLPAGQSMSLAQMEPPNLARMMICSLVLTLLSTAAGLFFFRRKDLK